MGFICPPMDPQSFRILSMTPTAEPGFHESMQMRMVRGTKSNCFVRDASKLQLRKSRMQTGAVLRKVITQVPEDTPEPALVERKSVTIRGLIVVAEIQMILRARFDNPKKADSFVAMLLAHDTAGVAKAMANSDKLEYGLLPKLTLGTISESTEM